MITDTTYTLAIEIHREYLRASEFNGSVKRPGKSTNFEFRLVPVEYHREPGI